ncbi:MAG: hypothetical protein ACJAVU_000569 [Cognaticolwellia sp.]|jgi:hypothetical protein
MTLKKKATKEVAFKEYNKRLINANYLSLNGTNLRLISPVYF